MLMLAWKLFWFSIVRRTPEDGQVLEGNDQYEGYSVDLIDGIAKILGFKYRFEPAKDNKYGSFNKVTKKWDGLVKDLLDRVSKLGKVSFSWLIESSSVFRKRIWQFVILQ